jgi:hypothetical protein
MFEILTTQKPSYLDSRLPPQYTAGDSLLLRRGNDEIGAKALSNNQIFIECVGFLVWIPAFLRDLRPFGAIAPRGNDENTIVCFRRSV